MDKTDKLTAIKLAIECSKYVHNLRGDWNENKKNIIKETISFIKLVYEHPAKFHVRFISNKAIIIYGPRISPRDMYVYLLYVSPKEHGKHYGKQLLDYAIENGKKFAALRLTVDKNNEKAIKFYKSNGFEIEKTVDDISYDMIYKKY